MAKGKDSKKNIETNTQSDRTISKFHETYPNKMAELGPPDDAADNPMKLPGQPDPD